MPPASSPVALNPASTHTSGITSPPSYLNVLQELNSPVLDLASTLSIQAENEIEEENLFFLRTPYTPSEGSHAGILNRELRTERRRLPQLVRDRPPPEARRIPAVDTEVSRMPSPIGEDWSRSRVHPPYGERVPNQQSLYDWAPGTEEGHGTRMSQIFSELRDLQPNTHPEILGVLTRARLNSERTIAQDRLSREQTIAGRQSNTQSTNEPSLRSAAILQNVRRNQRTSARSRDTMQRYVTEIARAGNEGDSTDSSSLRWFRQNAAVAEWERQERYDRQQQSRHEQNRHEQARLAWQGLQRPSETGTAPRTDAIRRRYLEDPSSKTTEFERVIKYLHSLRSTSDEHDKADDDFGTLERPMNCPWIDRATILNMRHTSSPRPTSWLTPGTTFTGFQQSSPIASSSITYHRLTNTQTGATTMIPTQSQQPHDPPNPWNITPPSGDRTTPAMVPSHEKWTVKVAIHDVDYTTMTLQGTMEAFNVPSAAPVTHAPTKATFSTYLEGELIDFTTNTLLTESFRTTPDIDATYWRKLEPFREMSDEDIARALLDRHWIEAELADKYVLMRWKEKCFVQPLPGSHHTFHNSYSSDASTSTEIHSHSPAAIPPPVHSQTSFLSATGTTTGSDGSGYGLSISGFYYISLRRTDGRCEGLYFDPQSTPYQHLELRPTEKLWARGVFEFR